MSERTRRAVVSAGALALAGCLGGTSGEPGTEQTASGAVLAYVRVANYDDTAHTVHVLVERGDEIVHWSSHELAASEGSPVTKRLDGPWGEPGAYTIHTRLDGADEKRSFDVEPGGADCYGVETRVESDATTSLWFQRSPSSCSGSTADG